MKSVVVAALFAAACGSTAVVPVPAPVINGFAVTPAIIKEGGSATLSWSVVDAATLTLDPGAIDVTGTASLTVSPAATTRYTLTATNPSGSVSASVQLGVTFAGPPTITSFAANPASIPPGGSATLSWTTTATESLKLDPGAIDVTGLTSKTVSPAANTTYTLTATNTNGKVTKTTTVSVLPLPTISAFSASPGTVTLGGASTLSWTATGATSLKLDPGGLDVSSVTSKSVTPSATTSYTLTATNASGSVTATALVTLAAPSIASFSANPASVASGAASTLSWSATGAASLRLDPGGVDVSGATSTVVHPTATTQYALTATNPSGSATSTTTVTVIPPPAIASFSASPAAIALGGSSTLSWSVTGATSLSIDNGVGAVTGTSKSVSPSATTTYTLTATGAGGTSTATATVSLSAPSIASFSANPASVAPGGASTLSWSTTGAASLKLDPGAIDVSGTTSRAVNPTATTQYALTATNASGSATSTTTVTVTPPPAIASFSASPGSITLGGASTLSWSVTGATSLSIDNGVGAVTGTSKSVSPSATTTYTLTATGAGGTSTATATVTLNPPAISAFSASPASIASGGSSTLSWTATGAASLRLDPGAIDVTGQTSKSVSPSATTTYTLTATNASGTATASAAVNVSAAGAPSIGSFSASPTTVTLGGASTLSWSVTGATTLTLDPGAIDVTGTTSKSVSPNATTTYTLTATNASGSVAQTATVTLAAPTITSFSANPTSVASGGASTLSWSTTGAASLKLDPGAIDVSGTTSRTVNPTSTTTYTLTATNSSGSPTATTTVTVVAPPVITSFSASPTSITLGGASTLSWSVTGATSLSIDNGVGTVTGTSKSVSPSATTTYTLTATNLGGSTTATATVTLAAPTITSFSANPTSVASGGASTLSWSTTGAASLKLDPGAIDVTGTTSRGVNPTATTTYTLTATNSSGSPAATTTVTVVAPPVITSFSASPTSVTLGGASTLSWSVTGATSLSIDNGVGTVTGTSKSVSPSATTTYTLTATNLGGSTTATATVTLAAPVISSFSANPASVASGGASTLSWSTTGAATLKLDPGAIDVSGTTSRTVNPTSTTTYTLTATNSSGSPTATTTVTVVAPPVVSSFSASPASIASGSSSTLSWTLTGATSLSIDNGVGTVTGTSKSVSPTATTTYTLSATNTGGTTTATTTVTVTGGSGYITPSTVTGDVVVSMDSHTTTAISPYIYGLNFADFGGSASPNQTWGTYVPKYTLNRFGGNRTTGHNFEFGYSNCGSDCGAGFPNDNWGYSPWGLPAGLGNSIKPRIDRTYAADAGYLMTVPIIGYVAKDANGNTSIPVSADGGPATPDPSRWQQALPGDGGPGTATPNTSDAFVYTNDYAAWIDAHYPTAKTDPVRTMQYELDNEPDIWGSTHEEIRGSYQGGTIATGFDELINKSIAHARAIKGVVPSAVVWGGAFAGFDALTMLHYPDHTAPPPGYTYYFDYYLKKIHDSDVTAGARSVDVVDQHWYPQVDVGHAIFSGPSLEDDSQAQDATTVNMREQLTRSLWDPLYAENSWVATYGVPGADATNCQLLNATTGAPTGTACTDGATNCFCPLHLLTRMQARINTYYPGTKLAIGEWWYGRGGDISGGIAVADFLGILGKYGVWGATMWPNAQGGAYASTNATYVCALKAFDVYRSYDGAGAKFGDTAVPATLSDSTYTSPATQNERLTAYSSLDGAGHAVIVAINKTLSTTLNAGFAITHNAQFTTVDVWRMTGTNGGTTGTTGTNAPGTCTGPTKQTSITLSLTNAFNATIPPQSITVFVMK